MLFDTAMIAGAFALGILISILTIYRMFRTATDKIKKPEADKENAVESAFKRGATEWTRLNYPLIFKRLG